ncbi:MAG: carbon-nitrogen hydrolase [Deltaproteobacteria bacterium]|nr:carbon-nitrogen hydrolase [Deltaproteobacteria bacterium]
MTKKNHLTLGLIQMACTEDAKANLNKVLNRASDAKAKGAEIICFQELFLGPYFCQTNDKKFFELAETVPGPSTDILCAKAKELGCVLVASLYEKDGAKLYNTAVVIDADGKFLGKYRKVHIPDDLKNFYSEKFYFTPGDLGFKPFQTKFGKIGVLVCWDQWYPEAARSLALQGAEIIFYPTSIGWPRKEREQEIGRAEFDAWVTIQRSHAIANGVFVAACNRTGPENNLNFWGGSFVADPMGRMMAQASHDKDEILIAECDKSRIEEARNDWPFLVCRRTDAY